jgi:predicted nucleic acid-binding protein
MAKYYIDTNIWRDFVESRVDYLRPLGEFAFQFLKRVIKNKDLVIYSEFILDELNQKYTLQEIEKYCFKLLRDAKLIEEVPFTDRQLNEALKVASERRVSKGDAIHAILARDNDAVVITRDQHFTLLQDIVKSLKPEEVT